MTAARRVAAGDGVTNALRLAAEHRPPGGSTYDQLRHLASLQSEHPELNIHQGPGGEWYADLPLGDDEPYDGGGGVVHGDLPGLLGKLDEHLGPPG